MDNSGKRVVLVTGAGRGLGRALALAFAEAGERVAINDLTPINLDVTERLLRERGAEVLAVVADVSRQLAVGAMVQDILDYWGQVDVLVNNAAVAPRAELLSLDGWDWMRVLEVNLSGPLFLMQTCARVMREQGGGVMLNIAADPDWVAGLDGRGAFLASQQGLLGLSRAAANEFQAYNIRINSLCLGAVAAPQIDEDGAGAPMLAGGAGSAPGIPLDVVARRALALCAREESVNGQVVRLSG
jgi:NAD(P)-dependent dehydrogenase (short-subunit alcohol dehydrogenase family)